MPNLYEISMLCESVYKDRLLLVNWQSIDKQIGKKEISSVETGYYGEAFLQAKRQLIVVVHRGTKLYDSSEKYHLNSHQAKSNGSISAGNLINDAIVALKYVPPETQPALDFALRISERYPQYTIVHTGHSLGALHANIVGYFTRKIVVGFDPVGCAEILLKILAEMNLQVDYKQLNQHLNLLAEPNLINQVNSQVGRVYQRKTNKDQTHDEGSITSRIKNTLATHKLKNFLDVITVDRINFGLEVPDTFTYIDVKATNLAKPTTSPTIGTFLNHGSLNHPDSTTILGVNIMRNSINGTHILTPNTGTVSILRRKQHDHVYLIIEWMDENQQRVTKRAELGYKLIDGNSNPPVYDKTKAQIYFKDASHQWLVDKSTAREFYFRTFEITMAQKDQLLQKITADQSKDLGYVEFGNQDTLAGGAVGFSLDSLGSSEAKNKSIESNHAILANSSNFFISAAHSSIDASLHRGYSCVSWAMQTIQHVIPDYKPTLLGELFVSIPEWEVASEGQENNTEGPKCCLI